MKLARESFYQKILKKKCCLYTGVSVNFAHVCKDVFWNDRYFDLLNMSGGFV